MIKELVVKAVSERKPNILQNVIAIEKE